MSIEARTKCFHVCMDLLWLMQGRSYPEGYTDLLRDSEGGALKPDEALTHLTLEKAKGHKVIPMAADCGNPCTHQDNGCSGFDFKGGGCPGHYVEASP